MSLSDIHKVMSYPKSVLAGKLLVNAFKPKGNGKDLVIVIEDGCYKEHSYFQLFQIQNNLSIELQVSDDLQGIKKNTFDEFYKVVESLNEMDETMLNFNDEEAFQEAQREMREAEQEMDRLLGDYKRYSAEIQSENDEDGHGTAVVAALTATIPSNSRVKVLRHLVADPKSNILNTFKQALSENPIVVNCSFVHFEDPAGLDKKFIGALFNLLWNKENETLFVFGAGNSEKSTGFITDLISVYTQIPTDNVLVVGGAYYDKMEQDTFPKLYASNAAHGFRSDFKGQKLDPIPHVCGICGPTTELPGYYIKVPRYSSDGKAYSFRNATSFAAPQITGICVAIKAVCPSIKPAEMKEIIMRTATPVPNKTTAQGISLTDITHKIKGDIIHPGLANGNLAVFAAQYYNLLKTGGGQVSVKEAVDYAKLIDEGI